MSSVQSPPGSSAAAVVGLLVGVEFVSGYIQGVVPTVTPALGTALGVDSASLNWINSVFLLSSALWVPVLSKLGDLYGHRRLLRLSVVLLIVGSVLVALAPTLALALAGRVLQGALLCFLPLEMALVRDRLDTERARAGIAILIGALTLGVSAGSVAGGALLDLLGSVHMVLWVSAAAAGVCATIPFFFVPESRTRAQEGAHVDWAGAALLALGLGLFMLALAFGPQRGWADPGTLTSLLVGATVLVAWCRFELHQAHPLVAIRHLAQPRLLALYCAAALAGMALLGSPTVVATFAATPHAAGYGFGLSGTGLGFFLQTTAVSAFVASLLAPRLVAVIGQSVIVTGGFVLIAVAFAATMPLSASLPGMVVALGILGLGGGTVAAVLPAMILEQLPRTEGGISAGVYNMVRTLGGSVMAGVFAAVLASATSGTTQRITSGGYTAVWAVCAAVALLGATLALAARGRATAESPAAERVTATSSASG
ncbi:MFS transporter [Streptomyces sp. NPDC102279]|uniref:MFS transporter n=1 Tax=Streptomyces sp. NPDC102279 TaxID=3366153 RepID=UPI003805E458